MTNTQDFIIIRVPAVGFRIETGVGRKGCIIAMGGRFGLRMAFVSVVVLVSAHEAFSADVGATRLEVQVPVSVKEPLVIRGESMQVLGEWTAPETRPVAPAKSAWVHKGRVENKHTLAGREGDLVADTFSSAGMELCREVWLDASRDAVAIRLKLTNRGAGPIRVDSLVPLRCSGQDALKFGAAGASDWRVLAQQRFKDGTPAVVVPSQEDDKALETTIEADPFCLFQAGDTVGSPVLLAGYISQLGHCSRLLVKFKKEGGKAELDSLTADCEFDGIELPAGEERKSQWLLLRCGHDAEELVSDFADRIGRYYRLDKAPGSAPSVVCSWYYLYGEFGEKNLVEALDYLAKDRIEFNVMLIDDSWDRTWGNWQGNALWPSGMKAAAERIVRAGYKPGIWTCPVVVHSGSTLAAEHPEWILRLDDGTAYLYGGSRANYILDPTYPGVSDWLEGLFRRLRYDWGFVYFKLDFMQKLVDNKRVVFYDRSATRLEAYRRVLEAIRRGVGPDAYISVCGGHYGGSIGIANSQRSGSDMKPSRMVKTARQNLYRSWMNRLWHVDPDAMMVRNAAEGPEYEITDAEERLGALNQYLGGGMVTLSFAFRRLDGYTKSLYRHIIPSVGTASSPVDFFEPFCPSQVVTRIKPRCGELAPCVTLAVINWTDKPKSAAVTLSGQVLKSVPVSEKYLVFDFFEQKVLGLFRAGAKIELGKLGGHDGKLLRIAGWDGKRAVWAGTDLHFSGGAVEVTHWQEADGVVSGEIETKWKCPVRVTAAFPAAGGYKTATAVVGVGEKAFRIVTR